MDTTKKNALRGLRVAVILAVAAGTAFNVMSCDSRSAAAPTGTAAEAHDDHEHGADEEREPSHKDHDDHGHAEGGHEEDGHDGHAHDEEGHSEDHSDEVRLSAEAVERIGIRLLPAERVPLVAAISAPARVTFNEDRMAHIGSILTGRVAELPVTLGDRVEAGQILLVLDSPELGRAQSELLTARITAATAQPSVDIAKDALQRARSLYESTQGIALSDVQRLEAELRSAEAQLQTARAAESAARDTLRIYGMEEDAIARLAESGTVEPRFVIRSPIAGEVVDRDVTLGELVGPERDALLVIANLSEPWVIADVPEARLRGIEVGAPAEITVAGSPSPIAATVRYVAPVLDPRTRTARVRVVPDGSAQLRPGMFAAVHLSPTSASTEQVLAVPEEAVQTVEGRSVVFVPVAGEPNTFAARTIRHGPRVGRMVPVLSGLKEGEHFVASGSFILKADLGKSEAGHEH